MDIHGDPLPDSRTFTFRGHDARDPRRNDAAVANDWCWGAESDGESNRRRRTLLDARRGRVRVCVDLVAAAALACRVLASLALALHATTARPRHGSCQTLITLTRRPLSVSRALHVLSSCVLCAWRRLPLICWKLLMVDLCVCTRRACCLTVSVHRTSAASVELFPRGWRAVAFPRWLHVHSCSTWLIVILMDMAEMSWFAVASAARVHETGLLLVCACRTSAASVEPLPRGSRAVAFPRWLRMNSKLLDVARIVRFSHQFFLLCFGFIGANSN